MGRKNQNAFIKKQKEEKKRKKKEEKKQKKEVRKNQSAENTPEDMIAYIDKDGNITSEPPE
ncbi:MAG: cold-shock protein [Cyclobacteriaceae bacterium]|nr:cold-shock protein [Cyclobacteriaceae bacterium]